QNIANALRIKKLEDCFEWKAVRRPKRKNNRILCRGCLQLKIERPAEAFAQRESPRAIQATAERRMNYDVRAAVLVKESFDDDLFLRRHRAERDLRHREVFHDLLGGSLRDSHLVSQPIDCRFVSTGVRTGSSSDQIN